MILITVEVYFKVKKNEILKFIEYTKENVRNSLKEEGVKRFEFYQEQEINKNNLFILFEIYKTKEDQSKHREIIHFKKWKDRIIYLLEEPYKIKQYKSLND